MNGYFPTPPAFGADPYSRYAYMNAPKHPTRPEAADQLAKSILGQPAQNVAQGAGQLAAGIGIGLRDYVLKGHKFPTAPGGAQPSFMTGLANFITGRQNGGLY